ncbi:diguanylate cyclase, partial [Pseudomonas corrugata]|nr:diguanylate cyclase [Pseudomonas corrugata]
MLGRKRPEPKGESPVEDFDPQAARPGAALRLTISFMLVVVIAFLSVEGWRTWRDYRAAFSAARDSVTNLARATAQHAEDTIRQVDVVTAALSERVEGDGFENIDIPRLHKLLVQQSAIMPQLHGLFIYGPDGQWVVTDKET